MKLSTILSLCVFAFLMSSCEYIHWKWPDDEKENEALLKWESQYEAWKNAAYSSYSYIYTGICFCPPEYAGPFRIYVEDNKIVDAEFELSGDKVELEMIRDYAIDVLFEFVKENLKENPEDYRISYDPDHHFPNDVYFDFDHLLADEEQGFFITEFEVIK